MKWQTEKSVLGLAPGEGIRLTAEDHEKLATAFLDELAERSSD